MSKRKSRKVPKAEQQRVAEPGRAARIGSMIVRYPREFVGLFMATIATGWIFSNALFLQKGPHPAPFFAPPLKHAAPAAAATPMPPRPQAAPQSVQVEAVPVPPPAPARQAEPARRNDPIAALLAPSPRVAAVQKALSDFAYGRVSPTGIEDLQTRAAIERFQQRRGLKVDGRISEPFLHELTKVTGRTFE
jgi:hypothetical protein